jgi:recombination protein RecA
VQKSGSFFSYGELRLGQGRNNTKQYLAENPETTREIQAKLSEALGVELQGRTGRPQGEPSEAVPIAEAAADTEEPQRKAA